MVKYTGPKQFDIKYKDITNIVAQYLYNNCVNVVSSRFNALPECFTTAYVNKRKHTFDTGADYVGYINESIVSDTAITLRATTKDQFISAIKASDYCPTSKYPDEELISTPKFLSYFNNVCKFCVKNVGYVTSPYNSTKYLVYNPNGFDNTTINYSPQTTDDVLALPIFKANSSGQDTSAAVIQLLEKRLNSLLRHKPCRYSYSYY